ncbi:hypothetical protein CPB97_006496 [Podila verticillata]|nr:hypothetical protein CPB97_006496 [Podila verticillata]
MIKRATTWWGILIFIFSGFIVHFLFTNHGERLVNAPMAATSRFTEDMAHSPKIVACTPPPAPPPAPAPAPTPIKTRDVWPFTQRNNVVFASTFLGGLGHKFGEVLVGIGYAEVFGLQFQFDRELFLANHRGVDLSWMADLIQERYPALAANAPRDRFIYIHDVFSYPPTPSPDQQANGSVTYNIDMESPCGGRSCYYADFSFFNAVPHLKDLLGMKPDSRRENRIAVHLRFGDTEEHITPEQYQRIIGNLRSDAKKGEEEEEVEREEEKQPEVHFVYSSGSPDELILQQLKAEFPEAVFRDLRGVEEGLRYLAESAVMITSGSSYSVMAAYLCNGCRVVFAKPKYKENPMTEENYTKNYYYVEGWEPYFRLL